MTPSEVNDKASDFMSLLRFSPLPESMLHEIKDVQMKLETDIRLKCLEFAMNANCGSVQRTVDTAAVFLAFVMNGDAGKVMVTDAVFTASAEAAGQG